MTPTAAEIFERAKSLSREERAELVQELLATLAEHDISDAARLEPLRTVANRGVAGLSAGDGTATTNGLVLLPAASGQIITDEMVADALDD